MTKSRSLRPRLPELLKDMPASEPDALEVGNPLDDTPT